MEDVEKIVGGVLAIVAAVSTIVARFNGTDKSKGFFGRLFVTFDLSQVFDSTRKLSD